MFGVYTQGLVVISRRFEDEPCSGLLYENSGLKYPDDNFAEYVDMVSCEGGILSLLLGGLIQKNHARTVERQT